MKRALLIGAAVAIGCTLGRTVGDPPGGGGGDGGVDPPTDDGGVDPPVPPKNDGGTSSTPDGGSALPQITIPGGAGWTFYGPGNGGPREAWGVSSDEAGNLWVAGGDEGLFVLKPGSDQFLRFTIADGLTPYTDETGVHQQRVVSVGGAGSNQVYAGYEGHFGGHEDADPDNMRKSGDADLVTLQSSGISVQHVDISTPPGMYPDPDVVNGRDKIRTVWRAIYDRSKRNVWFGGNHGVAMWEAQTNTVYEHQHAAINACDPGHCTLLSGDWFGVALDGNGDVWMGGGHRLAKLQYSSGARFWGPVAPIIDVWPDASDANRVDDFIQDLAVIGGAVWIGSIPNGLAYIDGSGTHFVGLPALFNKVTSLEADPSDGSLWIGLQWGGILRLQNGGFAQFSDSVFGLQLIDAPVWDIQSDHSGGSRRILAAFRGGAIGVYSGP